MTEEIRDWKLLSGESELPIVQSGLSLITLAKRLSIAEISAVIRCIFAGAMGAFDIYEAKALQREGRIFVGYQNKGVTVNAIVES